jgi:streptogramin lyase
MSDIGFLHSRTSGASERRAKSLVRSLSSVSASRVLLQTALPLMMSLVVGCGGNGSSSAVRLESIEVTPANLSLAVGTQQQLSATGIYSDHSTRDLAGAVTWSTSNPAVALAVNDTQSPGLFGGIAVGSATITATFSDGTVSGSSILTVTSATLVSLDVTPSPSTLASGTRQQYVATGTFSDHSTQNLTSMVTWTSDTPSVATISNAAAGNGLATAVSPGHANLSASLGAITSAVNPITVTAATLVSIQVTANSPSLALGTTEMLQALGTFSDQSTQDLSSQVLWLSSNTQSATVSTSGRVTTATLGRTQITASLNGVTSAPVSLDITDATLIGLAVTANALTLLPGQTQPFIAIGTYSDNSTQNLTSIVSWNSDTPGVATVSNATSSNGWVSAVGDGTATVTARFHGITSGGVALTVVQYLVSGASAGFSAPWGVAVDRDGNVYVADSGNSRICKINARSGCTELGASAGFNHPLGVAVDSSGNVYVADTGNSRICEINSQGGCTVLGSSAGFNLPAGIAVDSGNIFVADSINNRICEVTVQGGCTPVSSSLTFFNPHGIAASRGYLYVADDSTDRICEIDLQGNCILLTSAPSVVKIPIGIAVDSNNNIYVADFGNDRVCEITSGGACTVLDTSAGFGRPTGVAGDGSHNVYVADPDNNRIVEIRGL